MGTPSTVDVDGHLAIVREQLNTDPCPVLTQVAGVSATVHMSKLWHFQWGNAATPTSHPDGCLGPRLGSSRRALGPVLGTWPRVSGPQLQGQWFRDSRWRAVVAVPPTWARARVPQPPPHPTCAWPGLGPLAGTVNCEQALFLSAVTRYQTFLSWRRESKVSENLEGHRREAHGYSGAGTAQRDRRDPN